MDTVTMQKSVVKRYKGRLKIVTAISHFSLSRISTLLPAEHSQDSGKKCGMHGREVLRNSRNPHISQTEQRPQGKPQGQQSSRKASHFVSAESQKRKRQSERRENTLKHIRDILNRSKRQAKQKAFTAVKSAKKEFWNVLTERKRSSKMQSQSPFTTMNGLRRWAVFSSQRKM